jgi:SAM-dependent methyltransferase
MRQRRALSHVGGSTELRGDDPAAGILLDALAVRSDERATRAHVHGFHSYTARMHPLTARRLIEGLSARAQTVLDPFCGSGTVLVEAQLLGRRALGVDANPLAIMLARLKTRRWSRGEIAELAGAGVRIADGADARRRAKAGATRSYGARDRASFAPHVLFELDGLRTGIEALPIGALRDALGLTLSSILVKVESGQAERRLASGFTIRMFARRCDELARQLGERARMMRVVPACDVALGDARKLEAVASGSIDLVVTSPPYPGVYDYVEHHEVRLRWLGLDIPGFAAREIGSRRELDRLGPKGLARWKQDYGAALSEIARVLTDDGAAVLLIADSAIGKLPLPADDITRELAARAGARVTAIASQRRPHFHGPTKKAFTTRSRSEHAILLRP